MEVINFMMMFLMFIGPRIIVIAEE